jgi:hypothetical protein
MQAAALLRLLKRSRKLGAGSVKAQDPEDEAAPLDPFIDPLLDPFLEVRRAPERHADTS